MRKKSWTFPLPGALALVLQLAPGSALPGQDAIRNGDCNGDGKRDISDAACILNWLFSGGPRPVAPCPGGSPNRENGDTNGDGGRDISDAVHLLNWLFSGAAAPVPIACAPAGAIRFAALGKQGKGNTGQHEVAAALRTWCAAEGCDFVVLLGDNILDNGAESVDDPQWAEKFEVPYAAIDLPFYAVLGNNDYGGSGAGYEFEKGPIQVAYSAVSGKFRMPSQYYRFSMGDVEFFALDTNMQLWGQDAEQRTDVARWLAESAAAWKIAIGHHAYRSNGPHGNAGRYDGLPDFVPIGPGRGVKDFFDDIVCGKADLYLGSFDSSLQWLAEPCAGTELILSGTGSSTTELEGSNPVHFQAATLGFVYIVIEERKLTAEFVSSTGEVLFRREIEKPAGQGLDG